jgi:DNA-binding transcriptional MerR regulator
MAWNTPAEVAARYRVSPATLRYWRHVGKGPRGVKIGRRYLYDDRDLAQYDDEMRAQATNGEPLEASA